ncbi:endoplasmic reticulum membrane-associated RNA degradation protein-like [Topomyia yanbarensis]|uniref:endoplasmic reticulum membrane-associated RNA degradation protein-like n=1 Tax=Topomyia yanbarensis TaxID=2498891 RepID=UPI00273CA212|nr:endoplasmic reticulum membrane-associated RNA degradation protein-like [Topomyia yanbarensis]
MTAHESFFSDEIKKLCIIETKNVSEISNNFAGGADEGTIDWAKVEAYFGDKIVHHSQPLQYYYCRSMTTIIHQFLICCPTAVISEEKLSWTNRLDMLSLVGSTSMDTLSSSLILTSIVEYSLGNVYQTETGTVPPHLLRDLLMTDVLVNLLGETPVYLLRLLLGTPNGINLRNLVWHGFSSPQDVSPLYVNFLLLMLTSIGERLNKLSYVVKHREYAEYRGALVNQIKIDRFCVTLLGKALHNASDIPEGLTANWQHAIKLYNSGEYYQSVCIALPQLEMYLRKLYGTLYDLDYRAKIAEYYIIMDTIFDEFDSSNTPNKIYNHFSTSLLELVYDFLTALDGPRIRDKLSHGELKLLQIDESIANRILHLSYLLLTNDSNFEYRSIFHRNAMLKFKLQECEIALERSDSTQIPPDTLDTPESDILFLPSVEIPRNVPIFYRHARESEIVGFLTRICIVHKMAIEYLHKSLSSRMEALAKRELRSRARNTLDNMLRMFPTIWQGLKLILQLVKWIFFCLMECADLPDATQVVRFLKFVLKYTENAAKNLNSKSNAWQPLYEATKRELYDKTRQNLTMLLC